MKKTYSLLIILLLSPHLYSQHIDFTDLNLKAYLLNENCLDTNNDNVPDISADLNNDGEIQISEALSATNLYLSTFPDNYYVESIQDISNFYNLETLSIIHLDSLEEISLLGLTNLTNLNIGSCYSLKYIDLSDLPNIIDQRIEDIGQLEYLNIQNDNFPSGVFSLFYTENIQFACIDNISEEYTEVSLHMQQGLTPTIHCSLSTNDINALKEPFLYPNPATNAFAILDNNIDISRIIIFDINGKIQLTKQKGFEHINISLLTSGVYFVKIIVENTSIMKKVIKK